MTEIMNLDTIYMIIYIESIIRVNKPLEQELINLYIIINTILLIIYIYAPS